MIARAAALLLAVVVVTSASAQIRARGPTSAAAETPGAMTAQTPAQHLVQSPPGAGTPPVTHSAEAQNLRFDVPS